MAITMIATPTELTTHIDKLIQIEPKFAQAFDAVGAPDLRRKPQGFAQLMRAIIGQQLSVAAARSIWKKLESAELTTAAAITAADDDTLRANGLSRQKIRYVRSLADHHIDFAALAEIDDEAVIKRLTAVTGIGRWTAEMYLLFSLGRADVLAVDDLAIQEGTRQLLDLDERPTSKQLKLLSQPWSPHRSAASLLIWAYYGKLKEKSVMPV